MRKIVTNIPFYMVIDGLISLCVGLIIIAAIAVAVKWVDRDKIIDQSTHYCRGELVEK